MKKPAPQPAPKDDWLSSKWRPTMGWVYMTICITDFVIFPILWSIVQAVDNEGVVSTQWSPITLQGAGLFHMAMGAILGVAAWGRTKEKLSGMYNQSYDEPPSYDPPMRPPVSRTRPPIVKPRDY